MPEPQRTAAAFEAEMYRRHKSSSRRTRIISCSFLLVAFAVAPLALFLIYVLPFLEKGFDDGPFYARPFNGALPAAAPDEEHSFRKGYLQVYNGHTSSPLLVITDANRAPQLSQVLDVQTNPDHSRHQLTSITIHEIHPGPFRYRADITGRWTYGHERGDMYFYKSGKVQRFYLSW